LDYNSLWQIAAGVVPGHKIVKTMGLSDLIES
jgi:hypothetical protein